MHPAWWSAACVFEFVSLRAGTWNWGSVNPGKEQDTGMSFRRYSPEFEDFPGGSVGKNLHANVEAAGAVGSVLELERSPGGENGNPLQYSCQDNPMDRGTWQATVQGFAECRTWLKQLSTAPDFHCKWVHNIPMWLGTYVLIFPEHIYSWHKSCLWSLLRYWRKPA